MTYHCAHCGINITVAGKPDSGGSCPTCKGLLCHRCAGGWCDADNEEPTEEED